MRTGFPLTNGMTCALCHINSNYGIEIAPHRLRKFSMPFDDFHHAGALHSDFCSGELVDLPYDLRLDCTPAAAFDHSATGFTLTGTHMSRNADAVRLLPYQQQQLQPQFDGLLWLPSRAPQRLAGTFRTTSRQASHFGFGLRDLPPDPHLGCRRV